MKIKLLLLLLLGFLIQANGQCTGPPPPPGLNDVFALDTDNDGFATFDIQYYIDHIDRPNMENSFGVSSSGYNFVFKDRNYVVSPLLFTNTIQNESCYLYHEYTGSGPLFEPLPPCFWPIEIYMVSVLRLVVVAPNLDFDNDGILNVDEDSNHNQNLMDDDEDSDGIINYKDATNNLAVNEHAAVSLAIYPNPVTNGELTFDSNATINGATIYDLSGKQLQQTKISSNTLQLGTFASGIYFVKFDSDQGPIFRKIIIQ